MYTLRVTAIFRENPVLMKNFLNSCQKHLEKRSTNFHVDRLMAFKLQRATVAKFVRQRPLSRPWVRTSGSDRASTKPPFTFPRAPWKGRSGSFPIVRNSKSQFTQSGTLPAVPPPGIHGVRRPSVYLQCK